MTLLLGAALCNGINNLWPESCHTQLTSKPR